MVRLFIEIPDSKGKAKLYEVNPLEPAPGIREGWILKTESGDTYQVLRAETPERMFVFRCTCAAFCFWNGLGPPKCKHIDGLRLKGLLGPIPKLQREEPIPP